MTFKPLLASAVEDPTQIKYPVMASPKYDGIRCTVISGVAVSRNLKPIRNAFIQSILGKPEFEGFDGELIVGSPTDKNVFRTSTSGVMSGDGEPDFKFFVFDEANNSDYFRYRYDKLWMRVQGFPTGDNSKLLPPANITKYVTVVPHVMINSVEELALYEAQCIEEGYEGIMVRDPNGVYKFGRSTVKEGILLKVKKFVDDEALIIGFVERMSNQNEAKTNALGRTERSTHKENMVGRGDLGAFKVRQFTGETFVDFTVGSGLNDADRKEIWDNQDKYMGKFVKFKHFEIGNYDAPRFPIFIGFRDPDDMSEG